MCAIFGLIDYKRTFSAAQRECLINVLATECEIRGTDATGFAFNSGGKLKIFKRPVAAHELSLRLSEDANVILGHTRMATQGDRKFNYNNHPFFGKVPNAKFALALLGLAKYPHEKIETVEGDILKIDSSGSFTRSAFQPVADMESCCFGWGGYSPVNRRFITRPDIPEEYIDLMLDYGYTWENIVDLCGIPRAVEMTVSEILCECGYYDE